MSDDPTEALPPRSRSLRILVIEDHASTLRVLARLLDHFGMNIRSLFVCSALLLFESVAYGAGSYQRTRDGKRSSGMIHLNVARRQRGPASATRMDSPLALVH
jgi:hypothetical protein